METLRDKWIRPTFVLVIGAGLLISIQAPVAQAASSQVVSPANPDALKVPLLSVACASPRNCVAVGAQPFGTTVGSIAAMTSDGGSTWASTPILSGVKYLHAVACATARTCLAVGENPIGNDYQGEVIRTLDGGRTWALAPILPKGTGELTDISCPTKSYCMAVGASTTNSAASALATKDAGRSWTRVGLPKVEEDLSLVTCTTRSKCVAEGTREATIGVPAGGSGLSIITTVDGGSTWKQSSLPADSSAPTGIPTVSGLTCPTQTDCLLVGQATPGDGSPSGMIFSSADGGESWTFRPVPSGTTFLNAISCDIPTLCAVVGGGIEARGGSDRDILTTSDGGQAWTSRVVPLSAIGLDGVACPTTTSCVAVGFGLSATDPSAEPGVVVVTSDGGATWTPAR